MKLNDFLQFMERPNTLPSFVHNTGAFEEYHYLKEANPLPVDDDYTYLYVEFPYEGDMQNILHLTIERFGLYDNSTIHLEIDDSIEITDVISEALGSHLEDSPNSRQLEIIKYVYDNQKKIIRIDLKFNDAEYTDFDILCSWPFYIDLTVIYQDKRKVVPFYVQLIFEAMDLSVKHNYKMAYFILFGVVDNYINDVLETESLILFSEYQEATKNLKLNNKLKVLFKFCYQSNDLTGMDAFQLIYKLFDDLKGYRDKIAHGNDVLIDDEHVKQAALCTILLITAYEGKIQTKEDLFQAFKVKIR